MLTLRLKIVHATIANRLSIDDNIDAPATKFADLGVDSLDTVSFVLIWNESKLKLLVINLYNNSLHIIE